MHTKTRTLKQTKHQPFFIYKGQTVAESEMNKATMYSCMSVPHVIKLKGISQYCYSAVGTADASQSLATVESQFSSTPDVFCFFLRCHWVRLAHKICNAGVEQSH